MKGNSFIMPEKSMEKIEKLPEKVEKLTMVTPPKTNKNHHKVDLRRELGYREKKVAEIKKEKMRGLADVRTIPRYIVTVDSSYARGNLDVLRMVVKDLEWKEYPFGRKDQHCDIHWHGINFEQNPDVFGGRVNKFPGMSWICSKNNLFRVLDQMHELFPREYSFYPKTWYLPSQLHEFSCEVRKQVEKKIKPRPTYIVKPDEGSQGEGIYLMRDPADYVSHGRNHVVQEYLWNVFLIDRYKFDLRVYVVLTSIEPLEFYVCKEGLARFSTIPYETPTNKNMHETFMHLTNYSLNKRSSTFNRSERDDEGSKRTLTSVLHRISRMGYDGAAVWMKIERIISKTMIALIPDMKVEMQASLPAGKPGPSCFQILGFDILLLHNLKPILLEINASPSLRIDSEQEVSPGVMEYLPSPKDEEVKVPLVRDTLLQVAPKNKLRHMEREKYGESAKSVESSFSMTTLPVCEPHSAGMKRRKEICEKRRRKRKEEEKKRREVEAEKHRLGVMGRDGVIHIETNHPRSSIIIIKADEDADRKQSSLSTEEPKLEPMVEESTETTEDVEPEPSNEPETAREPEPINENCIDSEGEDLDKDSEMGDDQKSNVSEYNSDDDYVDSITITTKRRSCLKKLYPDEFQEEHEKFRLYEKLAEVFVACLGVRAGRRLGPTGFRTFARRCRLSSRGVMNASIDILYIDVQRKWEHVNPERTTGLCFRGFLDACREIARRKFFSEDKLDMMDDFIDFCESNLQYQKNLQAKLSPPRLRIRRIKQYGYPSMPMPIHSREETIADWNESTHPKYIQPKTAEDVERFLRVRHQKTYIMPSLVRFSRRRTPRNNE